MALVVAFLMAGLLAGCGGGEREPTPASGPSDCDAASYPGPWSACPEAEWVRAVASEAGYRVVDDTGSALELRGREQNLYVWAVSSVEGVAEDGSSRTVAGITVTANPIRAWWDVAGLRVWVSGGSQGDLPAVPELEELVAASRLSGSEPLSLGSAAVPPP